MLFLTCTFVYGQENVKPTSVIQNECLKVEINSLLEKGYEQSLIEKDQKDSIKLFLSKNRDSTLLELSQEREVLTKIRDFLFNQINNSAIDNRTLSYSVKKELLIPCPDGPQNKDVDGFYKNISFTKNFLPIWDMDKINKEASKRTVDAITNNLSDLKYIRGPKFINDLKCSKNAFCRVLGSLLGSLPSGYNPAN